MKTSWWAGLVLIGVSACASKPVVPPPAPDSSRADFIRRGEYLFASDTIVSESGRTCAGCHENHVPFEDYSLARKYYDLDKLVDTCLNTRVGYAPQPKQAQHTKVDKRALREYVVYNYVLKGVIADEEPEGIRQLGEAMESFLRGDYDSALKNVRGARGLVKTPHNQVQSFALEGCIELFQLNEASARSAFASALRIDPDVRIDGYVFSPKIRKVLEETRASLDQQSR